MILGHNLRLTPSKSMLQMTESDLMGSHSRKHTDLPNQNRRIKTELMFSIDTHTGGVH